MQLFLRLKVLAGWCIRTLIVLVVDFGGYELPIYFVR